MLVFNKYLKELGYKKSDFTDSKDPRYKLDKERGVVEAQTWNFGNTIILEMYTYFRDFQENYLKIATPIFFVEKWEDGEMKHIENGEKEWHKIIQKIIDGLKAYLQAQEMDFCRGKEKEEQDKLYAQFDEAWKLIGEYMGCFWW